VDHIHHPIWFDDPKDAGDYKKVRRDIFVEDDVHFNQLGYDLYARFMKEVLQDIL
jgi:lysophospholipase L1-like esterase